MHVKPFRRFYAGPEKLHDTGDTKETRILFVSDHLKKKPTHAEIHESGE